MRTAALAALLASSLLAQHPNFSGSWKQDAAKSEFGRLPAPISVLDTIDHKEPKIHLTQTVVGPQGDSTTSEHDFVTDGQEHSSKPRNYTEKSTVKWEAGSLIFVNRREYDGKPMVVREKWALSPDARYLTKERITGDVKQIFVLEKQ